MLQHLVWLEPPVSAAAGGVNVDALASIHDRKREQRREGVPAEHHARSDRSRRADDRDHDRRRSDKDRHDR